MKNSIYIGFLAISLFASCNELEPEDVDFDVTVETTTVKAGEPVIFNFEGNPNFITVYSGDEGHKYANRNRTEIDASDIEKTTMSFTYLSKSVSTGHKDHFNIYLSADFPGLSLKDAAADNTLIHNHAWNDITEECLGGITDGSATATDIEEIDLSDYPEGFVLAFRYQGKKEITLQRTVVVSNLKIVNKLKNGKLLETEGADIDFSVFDTYPSNADGDPYLKVVSGSVATGTWNLTNWHKNEFRMVGSTRAAPVSADNDDWLISQRLEISAACDPDKGEVIKDISRRATSYEHVYNTPGTYTVTFLAGNSNIEGEKMVIKEMIIEVKE